MGAVKEIFSEYVDYFKATFARCMFLMHAVIVIWRTVVLLGSVYWFIALGIVSIVGEYFVTLIVRNGQEWNWVSPATVCYLVSVIPGLWLQKLYHLGHYGTSSTTAIATVPSTSMTLDFSAEDWMLLSEQTMMVTIILSRALLPKGKMTHNEMSQLLLLYLSLSSDIIDFLSIFGYDKVADDETYCYVLLFWWTWSLLQFTLVLTSTQSDDDAEENEDDASRERIHSRASYENSSTRTSLSSKQGTKERIIHRRASDLTSQMRTGVNPNQATNSNSGNDISESTSDSSKHRSTESAASKGDWELERTEEEKVSGEKSHKRLTLRKVMCSSELWAILVVCFLQDGPFLVNRLVVMMYFEVFNYTIIFFICKNILVLALQAYRIIALVSESKAKVKESEQRVKAELTARRYSTISLHSVNTIDEEDSDDEEATVTNGAGPISTQMTKNTNSATPVSSHPNTATDTAFKNVVNSPRSAAKLSAIVAMDEASKQPVTITKMLKKPILQPSFNRNKRWPDHAPNAKAEPQRWGKEEAGSARSSFADWINGSSSPGGYASLQPQYQRKPASGQFLKGSEGHRSVSEVELSLPSDLSDQSWPHH